jgi:general secretion pathway protein I
VSPSRPQSGFSLLEVLVAFAILAVSLGVLIQIFSRASMAAVVASQYSRAVSLAESRLAAVGAAIPLKPGATSGEPEDGIAWELAIVPATDIQPETGLGAAQSPPAIPYRVTVTVLWEDAGRVRRLALSTLRLGEPLE